MGGRETPPGVLHMQWVWSGVEELGCRSRPAASRAVWREGTLWSEAGALCVLPRGLPYSHWQVGGSPPHSGERAFPMRRKRPAEPSCKASVRRMSPPCARGVASHFTSAEPTASLRRPQAQVSDATCDPRTVEHQHSFCLGKASPLGSPGRAGGCQVHAGGAACL